MGRQVAYFTADNCQASLSSPPKCLSLSVAISCSSTFLPHLPKVASIIPRKSTLRFGFRISFTKKARLIFREIITIQCSPKYTPLGVMAPFLCRNNTYSCQKYVISQYCFRSNSIDTQPPNRKPRCLFILSFSFPSSRQGLPWVPKVEDALPTEDPGPDPVIELITSPDPFFFLSPPSQARSLLISRTMLIIFFFYIPHT